MREIALTRQVVEWFRKTNDAFSQQYGRAISSVAFVHVPIFATWSFQDSYHTRITNPGLNEERIGRQGNFCDKNSNNCKYNGADIPSIKALVETKGLMAVFSRP